MTGVNEIYLTTGVRIPEVLLLLMAFYTTDREKVVTPADWHPGQPALVPAPKTYDELLYRQSRPGPPGLECEDWFLCYKQPPGG